MFYKYPQTDVRASLPAAENQAESFPFLGNGSTLRDLEKISDWLVRIYTSTYFLDYIMLMGFVDGFRDSHLKLMR